MENPNPISEPIVLIKNQSKKSFLKSFVFYFFGVLFLFVLFFILFMSPPINFQKGVIYNIDGGSSVRSVSLQLKENNIIRSRVAFETFVILFGGEKHIIPGDYLFEKKLHVFEVARRISKGDKQLAPFKVTIPEGYNVLDVAEVFSKKLPHFNKEEFLKIAENKEGYLFPDTYFFLTDDTETKVIDSMSKNYEKKVGQLRSEMLAIHKTENEIITMASIIEREAKGDVDREYISGILWNRIRIGMPLQVDAWPATYKTRGLPAYPIANPGLESIRSAMYPKSSSYLYYLHGKDGSIRYAKTFAEHKANKLRYLSAN